MAEAAIARIKSAKDYYKVLDVDKKADIETIKKSYKKLALLVHPDRCKLDGATEAFKSVGTAYGCLSDEQKKKMYDMTGTDAPDSGGFGGGGGGFRGSPFGMGGDIDPDEIFRQFFQGGGFPEEMFAGGGGAGGPRMFTFNMGGPGMGGGKGGFPGFSFQQFNGFPQQQQQRRQQPGAAGDSAGANIGNAPVGGGGNAAGQVDTGLDWLAPLINLYNIISQFIPQSLLNLVLIALSLYFFTYAISAIFSKSMYIFPILYLAPSKYKFQLLFLVLILAHFEYI